MNKTALFFFIFFSQNARRSPWKRFTRFIYVFYDGPLGQVIRNENQTTSYWAKKGKHNLLIMRIDLKVVWWSISNHTRYFGSAFDLIFDLQELFHDGLPLTSCIVMELTIPLGYYQSNGFVVFFIAVRTSYIMIFHIK